MGMLQRADFNSIKKKYTNRGKKNVRLTESTLILIQTIDPKKTTYLFPVLENNNVQPILPDEIRLNINDEFIINKCGVYLLGSMFDDGVVPNEATMWYTTPPLEMGISNILVQPLYSGGKMTIDVNNINFISNWDVKKHEIRTQTQFQNTSVGQPFATLPNTSFKEDGMIPMTPNVTLSGAKKNDISIDLTKSLGLPAAFAWTVPNDEAVMTFNVTKIALVFRGFLAQNASNFQMGKSRPVKK